MANKKEGYVLIYRSLFENDLWKSNEPFDRRSAWIDLIGMAQFQKRIWLVGNDPITLERGQLYVTLRFLADRWHWSVGKVRRFLSTLVSTGMSTQSGTPNGTLITLVKYSFFQDGRHTSEHTNGTQIDTQTEHIRNNINKLNKEKKKTLKAGGDDEQFYQ